MLLREKDKEILHEIFAAIPIRVEILAYGSRVNGDAHSGSDLDLVIKTEKENPLPIDLYLDICEKIRESNIPILIELRDWAMLPQSFHQNILKKHEVLYKN